MLKGTKTAIITTAVVSVKKAFEKVFTEIKQPTETMPCFITNISQLNADKLGDLTSLYEAWREFANQELLLAVANSAISSYNYKAAYDRALLKVSGKNKDITHALIMSDTDIEELYSTKYMDELRVTLLRGKIDSFEASLSILSRELTRRTSRL
jgi:hypothetical protein